MAENSLNGPCRRDESSTAATPPDRNAIPAQMKWIAPRVSGNIPTPAPPAPEAKRRRGMLWDVE